MCFFSNLCLSIGREFVFGPWCHHSGRESSKLTRTTTHRHQCSHDGLCAHRPPRCHCQRGRSRTATPGSSGLLLHGNDCPVSLLFCRVSSRPSINQQCLSIFSAAHHRPLNASLCGGVEVAGGCLRMRAGSHDFMRLCACVHRFVTALTLAVWMCVRMCVCVCVCMCVHK